jgi:hypothetical protein
MIWAEMGVEMGVALAAGACIMIVIMTAEWMLAASPQAEQKGLALLRSWLSPEQAQQYDAHKHFEVIGSDTGTRYRIRHGQMMNIDPTRFRRQHNLRVVLPTHRKLSCGRLHVGPEDRAGDVREPRFGDRKSRRMFARILDDAPGRRKAASGHRGVRGGTRSAMIVVPRRTRI